jgi:PadR family transcriptional regulator, regulatory protein PadR
MLRNRRPSAQTVAVVRALAQTPRDWRYGYELCQELGLRAGSMYPILMRLADRDLLETSWEESGERGRPPRHLYRLTKKGTALAAELEPSPGRKEPNARHTQDDAPAGQRRPRIIQLRPKRA